MTDPGEKTVATLVVRGLRQCLTMAGAASQPRCGRDQENIGLVEDAAVAVAGEEIVYAGPASGVLSSVRVAADAVSLDADGGVLLPGFVDPHTHLLFGGWRPGEFAQRVGGASYREILQAGGGILSTVADTRACSEEELVEIGTRRLGRMLRAGTTTVEAKSGYGLSAGDESKLVRAARRLAATEITDIAVTLLAAHAIPPEYRDDRDGYLSLVEEMIIALADRIDYVDAFCEEGAFSVRECRRVFAAARRAGCAIKIHADQLGDTAGAELAAEVGAVSADHLDYISTAGIAALAGAGVVAVLLPSVPLYVMSRRQAPARRLQAAGVPIALATDFNPGTSAVESMGLIVSLACTLLGMTPEAALVAATTNAAHAIGQGDVVGRLEPGMRADLQIYATHDYRMLPYRFGQLSPRWVIKRGRVVVADGASAS
ncbi:MAG TPA: imidazolonepropionase [Acidobacteriota bacterium]|nr:imidazolonepropionase [Acidobacteriota bacterium]